MKLEMAVIIMKTLQNNFKIIAKRMIYVLQPYNFSVGHSAAN